MGNSYGPMKKKGSVNAIVLLILFMVLISSAFVIYALGTNTAELNGDNSRCCKLTLLKN
jgi:quinol-cytochrome oxidoreductase complex cytochrome b subunit